MANFLCLVAARFTDLQIWLGYFLSPTRFDRYGVIQSGSVLSCGLLEGRSLAAASKDSELPTVTKTSSLAGQREMKAEIAEMQIDVPYCLWFQQMVIENY